MKKIILALLATLLPAIAMTEITNEQAIEQRQAAFKELKGAVAEVKDAMKAEDYLAAASSAEVIATNARKVAELFPTDSYEGDTRAKKKIWKKLDDFQQRQQKLIADADLLVTASQSNDAKELKSAFKVVSKDCKGCHMRYRQIF